MKKIVLIDFKDKKYNILLCLSVFTININKDFGVFLKIYDSFINIKFQ